MKKYFFTILLFSSFFSQAQIEFEEGYFIDDNGNRTQASIRNKDWLENPADFSYRTSSTSTPATATVDHVQEFGIGDNIKYVKYTGGIDVSPQHLKNLDDFPDPRYATETVFLKVLLEGEINLYKLKIGSKESYYIKEEGATIQPLVFKKYLHAGKMATNNKYRNQLYSNYNCEKVTAEEYTSIDYNERDLLEFFEDYHICRNSNYNLYNKARKRADFNLYLKAGVDFSTLDIESGYIAAETEHNYPPSIRIGAEAELVLPFLRNKWGVFLESTYRRNTFQESFTYNPVTDIAADLQTELSYVTFSGGIRHFMFLNESSKLFLNVAGVIDAPVGTKILFIRDERYVLNPELESATTNLYFSSGLGFAYNNKINAEVRYEFGKRLTGRRYIPGNYFLDWRSTTSTISFILGYRIF